MEDDREALTPLGPTNHSITLPQLKTLNLLAYICTVAINGLAATGLFSQYGVGTVSDMNPTLITPDSGAFSIWAVIYSLEAYFLFYYLAGCQPTSSAADDIILHGIGFWYVVRVSVPVCLYECLT